MSFLMVSSLLCPLCNQPVTKKLYEKITGIWIEKQKAQEKIKAKLKKVELQRLKLEKTFREKEKTLSEKYKKQAAIELARKTGILNEKSKKLALALNKQKKDANTKLTEQLRSQEKTKAELKRVNSQRLKLEKTFREKEKTLSENYKKLAAAELAQKTKVLTERSERLTLALDKQKRDADKKIAEQIRLTERREKSRAQRQIAQIKTQMKRSVSQELKDALSKAKKDTREKFLNFKKELSAQVKQKQQEMKQKAQEQAQKREERITLSRDAAVKQMSSLRKITTEQASHIQNLERQLKNETTPQSEGLLYEGTLISELKKVFPKDIFQHTGKGGDIVHRVIHNDEIAGIIVYECKKVRTFQTRHIMQTTAAKLKRKADYGILVTNAKKAGAGNFFLSKDIIVIHPDGVLPLVRILRQQIIQISAMKLGKEQRDEAIQETIKYLEGAEFKNGIETIVQETLQLRDELKKEMKAHFMAWQKRYDTYKKICLEGGQIKGKTFALLTGKKAETSLEAADWDLKLLPHIEEVDEAPVEPVQKKPPQETA